MSSSLSRVSLTKSCVYKSFHHGTWGSPLRPTRHATIRLGRRRHGYCRRSSDRGWRDGIRLEGHARPRRSAGALAANSNKCGCLCSGRRRRTCQVAIAARDGRQRSQIKGTQPHAVTDSFSAPLTAPHPQPHSQAVQQKKFAFVRSFVTITESLRGDKNDSILLCFPPHGMVASDQVFCATSRPLFERARSASLAEEAMEKIRNMKEGLFSRLASTGRVMRVAKVTES